MRWANLSVFIAGLAAVVAVVSLGGCAGQLTGGLAGVGTDLTQLGQSSATICGAVVSNEAATLATLRAQLNGTMPPPLATASPAP